jgi:hypothetical protein
MFGQSNEAWMSSLERIVQVSSDGLLPDFHDALVQQTTAEQQMDLLSKRANRHLALLDAFLLKGEETHRQTSEELKTAQEILRFLAFTRLQDKY